ncbi:MAG: helix-turn-helix transcriptional regulator [Lachnospiraceae bacterium]|nr:helix-turn-helix transcriptional regulator [Lachnospiraceae bacterium]
MKDQNEEKLAVPCGNRIRLLRESLGMNQEEFGEFLDCSDESISKIERGIHMMKIWRMIRLCQACGVSMDYLVRGIETGNTEDVPTYVIEMYRNADSLELTILQDHMQSARREISRKQNLERQYKNGQDVS